jgi:endonuclease YncB( thermonuclease family)
MTCVGFRPGGSSPANRGCLQRIRLSQPSPRVFTYERRSRFYNMYMTLAATESQSRCCPVWMSLGSRLPVLMGAVVAGSLLCGNASHAESIIGVPRVVDGDTLEVSGTRIRLYGVDAPESKQLCTHRNGQEYACGAPLLPTPPGQATGTSTGSCYHVLHASGLCCGAPVPDPVITFVHVPSGSCALSSTGHAAFAGACHAGIESKRALQQRIGQGAVRCEVKNRDQYGRTVAVCFRGSDDVNAWMAANGEAVAYSEYSKDYTTLEKGARADRKARACHSSCCSVAPPRRDAASGACLQCRAARQQL